MSYIFKIIIGLFLSTTLVALYISLAPDIPFPSQFESSLIYLLNLTSSFNFIIPFHLIFSLFLVAMILEVFFLTFKFVTWIKNLIFK